MTPLLLTDQRPSRWGEAQLLYDYADAALVFRHGHWLWESVTVFLWIQPLQTIEFIRVNLQISNADQQALLKDFFA